MKMLLRIVALVTISWLSQEIVNLVYSSQKAENIDLDFINAKCSTKLDFQTIHEFQNFMSQVALLGAESADPLPENLKLCLNHRPALIDLKELIDNYDKKRPCKHNEVVSLENYARKHFMNKKGRPWSLKFFTLFGVNVGLRCKLNLLAHIKQADSEVDPLDFIYSMASPTGWTYLINEHTKKTMKFGTSSNAGNTIVNRVAKLVPGLTQVEQLDFMLFDQPKNRDITMVNPNDNWKGVESDTYEFDSSSVTKGAFRQVYGFLAKIVESCQNLDQFYYNSILSLARLNELGLLVSIKMLDEFHESSLMLHRWLAAASFCQVMVRVRVEESASDELVPKLLLKIIHDESLLESRRTLYSYAAEFDEISEEARANVWLASVSDGKWLRKDEAIFRSGSTKSVAMLRLRQFIKGLERDFKTWHDE